MQKRPSDFVHMAFIFFNLLRRPSSDNHFRPGKLSHSSLFCISQPTSIHIWQSFFHFNTHTRTHAHTHAHTHTISFISLSLYFTYMGTLQCALSLTLFLTHKHTISFTLRLSSLNLKHTHTLSRFNLLAFSDCLSHFYFSLLYFYLNIQ